MKVRLYVVVDANDPEGEGQWVADEIKSNLESVPDIRSVTVHILPEEEA